ncbi:MAG: 50S ribosomal protein L22 [Bacilli bacterium]|nr:50S ribosomal protein L22 [Bacilli bacterium]
MEAIATHKMAMVAPRKARMTLDLIRGKDILAAENILKNTNTKSSRLIIKVLNSAVANATNNLEMNKEDLVISECFINPGPVLKRIKFGSRTKVDRRDKRTSHITIKVSDGKNEEA